MATGIQWPALLFLALRPFPGLRSTAVLSLAPGRSNPMAQGQSSQPGPIRSSNARPGSHGARRHQAAAPTLDSLNAAAPSESEGHVDDAKVMNSVPAEKATDKLMRLRAIDGQPASSREYGLYVEAQAPSE